MVYGRSVAKLEIQESEDELKQLLIAENSIWVKNGFTCCIFTKKQTKTVQAAAKDFGATPSHATEMAQTVSPRRHREDFDK